MLPFTQHHSCQERIGAYFYGYLVNDTRCAFWRSLRLGANQGTAVIGNPPYVRQEQLAPIKPYLAQAYPNTYHDMADLYVYFYQQGLRLLRQDGAL